MTHHLVIMAAGTGGHVIPGLAVAREMQHRGWTVSWLGTRQGMENRLVPAQGFALDAIGFSGLRGKGLVHALTGGLRLLTAFGECLGILRRRRAEAARVGLRDHGGLGRRRDRQAGAAAAPHLVGAGDRAANADRQQPGGDEVERHVLFPFR